MAGPVTERASDGREINIREATDDDLTAVAAMLNREIAESPYVYADIPVTLDERRQWLKSHGAVELPVAVATPADGSNVVLGWGALSVYRPSGGYRFTVEASVYVAPFAKRQGIGGRLLKWLCDEAHKRQMHALVASIDAENAPSIALFERHGFREVARLNEVGWKFGAWRTQLLFMCAVPAPGSRQRSQT
jgi:phosphinothricin acetyltransferase